MRLKKFLQSMANFEWRLDSDFHPQAIRSQRKEMRGCCCPLTAAANGSVGDLDKCSKDLGFDWWYAKKISFVADFTCDELKRNLSYCEGHAIENMIELRQRLLKACGLEEKVI